MAIAGRPRAARFSFGEREVTRFRAAAWHLALSAAVAAAIFLLSYLVLYPGALFGSAGGRNLFLLIAGVNVAIGPLLTLVVFVPGKKGLAFDLWTIAFLQAASLAYGAWVLLDSRPAYIVFVKDRFELVRANEIGDADLRAAAPGPYSTRPWTGPRTVGARIPTDPAKQLELTMSALGGRDVQNFPQYYVAYDEVRPQVLARAEPFARLRQLNPASLAAVDRLAETLGRPEAQLRFLPMRAGRNVDLTVVLDAARGDILDIAALRPWEYR